MGSKVSVRHCVLCTFRLVIIWTDRSSSFTISYAPDAQWRATCSIHSTCWHRLTLCNQNECGTVSQITRGKWLKPVHNLADRTYLQQSAIRSLFQPFVPIPLSVSVLRFWASYFCNRCTSESFCSLACIDSYMLFRDRICTLHRQERNPPAYQNPSAYFSWLVSNEIRQIRGEDYFPFLNTSMMIPKRIYKKRI